MGKRKTRKPPPKKEQQKVPTSFDCPFCSNEKTVECKMDRKAGVGTVKCSVCLAQYQTRINYLQHPVDVYSEWIDECQKVQDKQDKQAEEDDEDVVAPPSRARYVEQAAPAYAGQEGDEDDEEDEEEEEDDQ